MADISSINLNGTSYNIKDGAATKKAFKTVIADGNSTSVVADAAEDTLTLHEGAKMSVTGNASTDTVTIAHYSGETPVTAGFYKVGKDEYGHVVIGDSFTIPAANTTATNIKMDGSQSAGSLDSFAKADHVHPSDTSKASLSGNNTFSGTNTFSGAVSFSSTASGQTPTADAHLATKAYVDGLITGVITFKGTKTSAAAIKALTNVSKGDMYIVSGATGSAAHENGQEWVAKERIEGTASPSTWEMLGTLDIGDLGALAYKDSGSVTLTPTGSITGGVSVSSVTVHEAQISVPNNSEILAITTSDKTVGASGAATSTIGFSGTEQTVSVDFA